MKFLCLIPGYKLLYLAEKSMQVEHSDNELQDSDHSFFLLMAQILSGADPGHHAKFLATPIFVKIMPTSFRKRDNQPEISMDPTFSPYKQFFFYLLFILCQIKVD